MCKFHAVVALYKMLDVIQTVRSCQVKKCQDCQYHLRSTIYRLVKLLFLFLEGEVQIFLENDDDDVHMCRKCNIIFYDVQKYLEHKVKHDNYKVIEYLFFFAEMNIYEIEIHIFFQVL